MNQNLGRERLIYRLAVAGLGGLAALNVLGIAGNAEPGVGRFVEGNPVPFSLLLLVVGVDLVALWIIALRTLAGDRDLPSFVRKNWLLPVVFLGMIAGPIFLIWRWRRFLRWLPGAQGAGRSA